MSPPSTYPCPVIDWNTPPCSWLAQSKPISLFPYLQSQCSVQAPEETFAEFDTKVYWIRIELQIKKMNCWQIAVE